jgi:Na+/proline symporter
MRVVCYLVESQSSLYLHFVPATNPFSTAGRMIKTGLTASVIVSQWTWAATLLQSSNVAWQYGVSGPFW